jgi:hypothetical protein
VTPSWKILEKRNNYYNFITKRGIIIREISDSHGGEYEDDSLLGYCAL